MKPIIKNTSVNVLITILGIGILVAGILVMALYHDMSWQSYVVIGVIMLISLWNMLNNRIALRETEKVKVRYHDNYIDKK